MKELSEAHIEILKRVLLEVCVDERPVPMSRIYDIFEKEAKSRLEWYKFKNELSKIIRTDKITGYQLKQGRGGGVMKTQSIERIELICSTGKYVGTISTSKLDDILSYLSDNHLPKTMKDKGT